MFVFVCVSACECRPEIACALCVYVLPFVLYFLCTICELIILDFNYVLGNLQSANTVLTPATKKSKLASLFASAGGQVESNEYSQEQLAKKQLDTYRTLVEKNIISFDDDPLLWWARFAPLVPELAMLARRYLAMQATSCSSERLFSKAGYIVSKYRTSLKSDNVSMLTFLATNSV